MKFIFDEQIASYVRENIWNVSCEFHAVQETYNERSSQEERKRNLDRQIELRESLRQHLDVFEKKTFKYMQLQQPRMLKRLQLTITAFNESIKNK